MRRIFLQSLSAACAIPVIALGGFLAACEPPTPQIQVEGIWSRPTPNIDTESEGSDHEGGSHAGHDRLRRHGSNGVVYLSLINRGGRPDRLIRVQSEVCEAAELHRTKMEGDIMRMMPVEGGLEIPAKGRAKLEPGGYHIMLVNLKAPLKVGARFNLVLEFEVSGRRSVVSTVRRP